MITNKKKTEFEYVKKFNGFNNGEMTHRTDIEFKNKICNLYTANDTKIADLVLIEDQKFKNYANTFVLVLSDIGEADLFIRTYSKEIIQYV